MTDEEFLLRQPKMTSEEILDRNVEYLGSYLFSILTPKPSKWFAYDQSKALSAGMFIQATEVLFENNLISWGTLQKLRDLINSGEVPKDREEAESRVREILFPE